MAFIYRDYLIAVLAGIFFDQIIGDPKWLYHPVQAIGALISFLEKRLLKENDPDNKKRIKGGCLVVLVVIATGVITALFVSCMYRINRVLGIIVMGLASSFTIAAKSLKDAAMEVYKPLSQKPPEIEGARHAVSMIVGRDTESLDEAGIIRATVETVAENTNDGVICPLFYLFIGGPILAFIYKAVSTMDSMIGYRNDKYKYFGTVAARLDDVFAFIPARLSAVCMIVSALLLRADYKNALRIFLRDRYKHESPNSAQCESVLAGALGLRLAGPASYFGRVKDKPYIGDDIKAVDMQDIKISVRIMQVTECVFVCAFVLLAALF